MNSEKSRLTSLWLCITLGIFGGHRFYIKRFVSGFIMLSTFGGLGLWIIIDFLLILFGQIKDGDGHKVKTWSKHYPIPKLIFSSLIFSAMVFGAIKGSEKIKFDKNLLLNRISASKVIQKTDTSNEIVKYTDNNGVTHFVNDISKVPEEYRENAQGNLNLPELNKASFNQ